MVKKGVKYPRTPATTPALRCDNDKVLYRMIRLGSKCPRQAIPLALLQLPPAPPAPAALRAT